MASVTDRRRVRSLDTKARLLRVGTSVFAVHGYDATTTRLLADAAGVNQASILYHYGGKEGLYIAIAEDIAKRGREAMSPYLVAPASAKGPREALATVLRGLLRAFLTVAGDGSAAAFIVREQANPGAAFERLYKDYIQPVHAHITALVASLRRCSQNDTEAIIAAHAIIGMALVFVTARETVLRRTKWRAFSAQRLEQITDIVVGLADAGLTRKDDRFA